MIKVIAFDLGGVLINEKDIPLSHLENKIERFFGKNNQCPIDFYNLYLSNNHKYTYN